MTSPTHALHPVPTSPRGWAPARTLVGAVVALAAALSVCLTWVTPAEATISRLCYGFSDCADKGYGNFGYRQNINTMWWRMYSGHNCTNYVAYRMVKSGMSTTRPWEGSGNATNWGYAMDRITDQTPAVGAVAWWKAYAPGAGSAGHVGVVEQVISADKIIVSQDSWGGDFSWVVITRSGSGWPTGFVHFNDADLRSVATPEVAGEPRVGATLSTDGGTWNPGDAKLAYQWRVGRRAVSGATAPTFTVRPRDEGKRVRVVVVASKPGYSSVKVRSARTAQISAGHLDNTSAPTVQGTAQVDRTLTATPGTWALAPDEVRYQWLADGAPISGATGATFVPGAAQVGSRIRVRVTAVRDNYTATTATSQATEAVAPGALASTASPTISGTAAVDRVLTAGPATWSAQPDSVRYQWLSAGQPISGATAATFTPSVSQLDTRIRVVATAVKAGYAAASSTSAATTPVARGTFASQGDPSVTGVPRPGETLTLLTGQVAPETTPTVQWLRDGRPILGATTATYAVTADDLGSVLSARLTRSRAGYDTFTATTPATALVRSPSTLSAQGTSPRAGEVRVRGAVTAPDVAPVSGTVVVRLRRQVLGTAELVDGSLDLLFEGVRAGERRLVLIHRATDVTTRSRLKLPVTVR